MADQKISELTAITGANTADDDLLVIVDTSASQTKKITLGELENALAERDFNFGDNDKLTFGAGNDLQIYHNAGTSFITESGTSNLKIGGENLYLQNTAHNENYLAAIANQGVTVYYNNAAKLSTTSTGIDVTGTVTADGLTVDGTSTLSSLVTLTGAAPRIEIYESDTTDVNGRIDSSGAALNLKTIADDGGSQKTRIKIGHSTGDISFYEDTGTTAKFFWDASAESLAIGSPSADNVTIYSTDDVPRLEFEQGGTVYADIGHRGASAGARQNIFEITTKQSEPIAFRTANTERMRIDSSGRVGIGTSSPDSTLELQNSSSLPSIALGRTPYSSHGSLTIGGTGTGHITSNTDADGNSTVNVNASRIAVENGDIRFFRSPSTAAGSARTFTEYMRIDSSGNVGIGTSSPSGLLELKTTTNNAYLYITADNASSSRVYLGDEDNATIGRIGYNHGFNFMDFYTNGSERMRIDSNGSLMVGGTDTFPHDNAATSGTAIGASGYLSIARSGGISGYFNRMTSDGDIVQFRKDGTTVGVIGTNSGNIYIGDGARTLIVDGHVVKAGYSTGTDADQVQDLGSSSVRWKDLYLSGGVYLGGTGSANKLDDYEEGTWSVNLYGNTTAAPISSAGEYTRIGNMVYAGFFFYLNTNSDTGHLRISGLPFNIGSGEDKRGGIAQGYQNSGNAYICNGPQNTNRFEFYNNSGADYTFANFSGKQVKGVFIYMTDA